MWAGVLVRFIEEMQVGDYIINPNKADRTLNFGQVDGEFYVVPDADVHPNRRKVRWLQTGVPRDTFQIGDRITIAGQVSTRRDFYFLGTNVLLPDGTEAVMSVRLEPYWSGAFSSRT